MAGGLRGEAEEFVRWARVARVATVMPDGRPHVIPISPLLDDGKLYFVTEPGSAKARNLESNPLVALVFDEYTEMWEELRQVMVQGRAAPVDDEAELARLRDAFRDKYPQYRALVPIADDDAVVRVEIERVVTPGFD